MEVRVFGEVTEASHEIRIKDISLSSRFKELYGKYCMDKNPTTMCHTASDKNGVVTVNLYADSTVNYVKLLNRSTCCEDRIVNAKVYVGTKLCAKVTQNQVNNGPTIILKCSSPLQSNFVKIVTTNKKAINLMQIEVYGAMKGPCSDRIENYLAQNYVCASTSKEKKHSGEAKWTKCKKYCDDHSWCNFFTVSLEGECKIMNTCVGRKFARNVRLYTKNGCHGSATCDTNTSTCKCDHFPFKGDGVRTCENQSYQTDQQCLHEISMRRQLMLNFGGAGVLEMPDDYFLYKLPNSYSASFAKNYILTGSKCGYRGLGLPVCDSSHTIFVLCNSDYECERRRITDTATCAQKVQTLGGTMCGISGIFYSSFCKEGAVKQCGCRRVYMDTDSLDEARRTRTELDPTLARSVETDVFQSHGGAPTEEQMEYMEYIKMNAPQGVAVSDEVSIANGQIEASTTSSSNFLHGLFFGSVLAMVIYYLRQYYSFEKISDRFEKDANDCEVTLLE